MRNVPLTPAPPYEPWPERPWEVTLRPPAGTDPGILAVKVTVSTATPYEDVIVAKAKAALGNRWTGPDGATVKAVRPL